MARYSSRALPPYRFLPGQTPHPPKNPETWQGDDAWRYAIDLFNHRYWWEAHEVLESLWNAAGRTTPDARILQGLIQVAAACLKREVGQEGGAVRLFAAGLDKLRGAPDDWRGLDVRAVEREAAAYAAGTASDPPTCALTGAARWPP